MTRQANDTETLLKGHEMLTLASGVTAVTHVTTKTGMSRWARAHAEAPGINWSVYPDSGGTMIIVEHEKDRSALTPAATGPAPSGTTGRAVSPAGGVASWAA